MSLLIPSTTQATASLSTEKKQFHRHPSASADPGHAPTFHPHNHHNPQTGGTSPFTRDENPSSGDAPAPLFHRPQAPGIHPTAVGANPTSIDAANGNAPAPLFRRSDSTPSGDATEVSASLDLAA